MTPNIFVLITGKDSRILIHTQHTINHFVKVLTLRATFCTINFFIAVLAVDGIIVLFERVSGNHYAQLSDL